MIDEHEKLTIVGIFPWSTFWSMGRGMGSPSFYLAPKACADAGHKTIILMPRGEEPAGHHTCDGIDVVRYRGGPSTVIEDMNQSRVLRFTLRFVRYVQFQCSAFLAGSRLCRRVKPDVLVAYSDHATPVTWLLGRLFRTPTVNRFFGTSLAPHIRRPLALYFRYVPFLGTKVPANYTISCDDGSGGDRVAQALGIPAERFRYWRDGADHGARDPNANQTELRRKLGLPIEGTLLYTASRFHAEKRIERILRALPVVLEHHPTTRFVVIGTGPERQALEAEVERLDIAHAVIWTGAVDREGLVDYWNAVDIFVATSDRTNAASPLFEAMLCARPPVVLDTGDTSKVVDHGVNGWLVPEDRPEELGPLLIEVLADMDEVRRVGLRALEWATANIPTFEKRQQMEVAIIELAAREARRRS